MFVHGSENSNLTKSHLDNVNAADYTEIGVLLTAE